jgi:Flp pilus assembly protein TadG
MIIALLRRFRRDTSATVATVFGLSLIPLALAGGGVVDYSHAAAERTALQAVADAAALAGASALGASDDARIATMQQMLAQAGNVQSSVNVDGDFAVVTATKSVRADFLEVVGIRSIPISVRSKAESLYRGPPVCVLALDQTASGAITWSGGTSFVANGCAVQSNSTDPQGLVVTGSATVEASSLCSAGGASVPGGYPLQPLTHCRPLPDPFASLQAPPSAACDYHNESVQPGETATLSPGVYCKGLSLKGNVTLEPGLYIVEDGPLTISSQASVQGDGVSFYLTGSNAGFTINGGAAIDLTAMRSGDYQGILIAQDRNSTGPLGNTLNGAANTVLTGAIYTPNASLSVTGSSGFGQNTNFMPLIADTIKFSGTSTTEVDLSAVATVEPLDRSAQSAMLVQ